MTKSCGQCGVLVKRKGLCAACRAERRRKQWRQSTSKYAAKKEISVPMWKVVEKLIEQRHEVRIIPPPPIRGKLTPRGPNEGCSTTNQELYAILHAQALEAEQHPWWAENPDVFEGL